MKKNNIRLLFGIAILPALFFQNNITALFLQTLYAIFLALSSGRKFKLLPNVVLLVGLSLAHLLQPNGLLLFTLGSFPITLGALVLGSHKAFLLISLIYLSQYMVSSKPTFPGKLGALISMQLFYFGQISLTWSAIVPKKPFIGAIDNLLFQLEQPSQDYKESLLTKDEKILPKVIHLILFWTLFSLGRVFANWPL
jgi:hypothetical protein